MACVHRTAVSAADTCARTNVEDSTRLSSPIENMAILTAGLMCPPLNFEASMIAANNVTAMDNGSRVRIITAMNTNVATNSAVNFAINCMICVCTYTCVCEGGACLSLTYLKHDGLTNILYICYAFLSMHTYVYIPLQTHDGR